MIRRLTLAIPTLALAACARHDTLPSDLNHPLAWWVASTAGLLLLVCCVVLLDHMIRAHSRRDDRRDRRDERGPSPKA